MRHLVAAALVCAMGVLTLPAPAGGAEGPARVLLVGDSLTQGGRGDYTYRYFLWQALVARGETVDFVGPRTGTFAVRDDGVWDWNYDGPDAYADPRFDRDHAAYAGARLGRAGNFLHEPIGMHVERYRPDVIVSLWGTNDLGLADQGPTELLATYREWVAEARAVDPEVDFVIGRLPNTWLFDGEVVEFNRGISDLGRELSTASSTVTVATMTETYTEADTWDSIHPAVSGQRKIAGMVGTALLPVFEARRRPGDFGRELPPAPAPLLIPAAPAPVAPAPMPAAMSAPALAAPTAPPGVRAQRRARRVAVSWRSVSSAQFYEVRAGKRTVRVSARRAVVRTTAKRVRVRAVNAAGASPWRRVRVRS